MDVRVRIGLNMQALRRAKGLTQEELGDRAELHQTYLSGIEQGRRNPSALAMQKIALALGADIEDLVKKRPPANR